MGPYVMAYVTFTGEYKNVGPTMNKLYANLSGAGIISRTGAGIYYTDPATTSGDSLRSDVGSIIDVQQAKKLDKRSKDYKIQIITGGNKVIVEFPYKNSFSYMVGPIRAYPVMNKYLQEKGYKAETPRIELYDMTAKKIYYMADIVK